MRTEALNHKYYFGSALPASRLVLDVADKHQRCTQSYVRRPYGVGLLVRRGAARGALGHRGGWGVGSLQRAAVGCQSLTKARGGWCVLFQIASYDQTGPHLYQTDPSGNYYDYLAMAIGARAQSGKTYLEK
jgi:20S proteasome subunit alpha 6